MKLNINKTLIHAACLATAVLSSTFTYAAQCSKEQNRDSYWYECDGVKVTQSTRGFFNDRITEFQKKGDYVTWRYYDGMRNVSYYYTNRVWGNALKALTQGAFDSSNSRISNFKVYGEHATWKFYDGTRNTTRYYANRIWGNALIDLTQQASGRSGDSITEFRTYGDHATWKFYDGTRNQTAYYSNKLWGRDLERLSQIAVGTFGSSVSNLNITKIYLLGDVYVTYKYYDGMRDRTAYYSNKIYGNSEKLLTQYADDRDNDRISNFRVSTENVQWTYYDGTRRTTKNYKNKVWGGTPTQL
ncbi:hypothetical protein [Pseudoalteromonas luteoviolacea]|uniref:hypothetical protein n=1 Tax=Pseudoalteromonas luteoviolacea TaxID=43657 RepID=UPI0007B047E1|nr:hypothetical protein [Pseudoalteromonas luteoviolacea]KZN51845.1 hypothetical protein N474_23635 [Pseudoalteromonas luteoviolacea CPMOR-2]TQF67360.1 hypothetical protein FLM44_19420 [Pseudoalteromonas luteoviolacea]